LFSCSLLSSGRDGSIESVGSASDAEVKETQGARVIEALPIQPTFRQVSGGLDAVGLPHGLVAENETEPARFSGIWFT